MTKPKFSHRHLAVLTLAVALSASLVVATGITRADPMACSGDMNAVEEDYLGLGQAQEAASEADDQFMIDQADVDTYCNQDAPTYDGTLCSQAHARVTADTEQHTSALLDEMFWTAQLRTDQEAEYSDCTYD